MGISPHNESSLGMSDLAGVAVTDYTTTHYTRIANALTYYKILGLHPAASEREIRQAYRELSRQYHPDTTHLPTAIAKQKFQQLNEAYGTLSSQVRRHAYDQAIGYARVAVVQPLPNLSPPPASPTPAAPTATPIPTKIYADPSDRPLSSGEIFVLFIMTLTLIGCLLLAIVVGLSRGDVPLQPEFARELGFQPPTPPPITTAPVTAAPPVPSPERSLDAVISGNMTP
jgi:DnaJ domain